MCLAALFIAAMPLAAPGPRLVPAATTAQSWLLGLFGHGFEVSAGLYYGLLWIAFASYLGLLLTAPALGRRLLWASTVGLVLIFALAPPLLSQDVFSYIDYARLGAIHGLDPYLNAPASLPHDPAFPYIGWTDSTSAYGPLFTILTYPLAWVSVAAALWLFKAIAALSVLALARLVARLAQARGGDERQALVLVALNPLVLVHVVGGGHNDAMAMALAMAGCAALLALRLTSAGGGLVAAAALKASSAFVLPFGLLAAAKSLTVPGHRGQGRHAGAAAFLLGAGGAALLIALLSQAAFGWHWLDSLYLAGENQRRVSNYSVPNLLGELLNVHIGVMRTIALASYVLLTGALVAWVWRGGDWIRASGWAALGLLLASAWTLPWYVIWVLPFAALSRDRVLVAGTLALSALQLAARLPL